MEICGPKGRDCIEGNFTLTFNCSLSCEGVYADVQWIGNAVEEPSEDDADQHLEVKFNSKLDENLYRELYAKLKNDLEMKMQLTKGDSIKTGEEVDRMKFQRLIGEYKNFKRNRVQHFRFNSASNQTAFGQSETTTLGLAITSTLQCFR